MEELEEFEATDGVAEAPSPKSKKKKAEPSSMIEIPAPTFQMLTVSIIGDNSLISNAIPQKFVMEMRERGVEKADPGAKPKRRKTVRNFRQEYEESLYPLDGHEGEYGFPAAAFHHAMIDAVRQVDGLDMTLAKRLVFVLADGTSRGQDVVRIHFGELRMREDYVRLQGPSRPLDLRYRGEFVDWHARLNIRFNASIISPTSVLHLLSYAGISEGVGENRPSSPRKPGLHGRWHVAEGGGEEHGG